MAHVQTVSALVFSRRSVGEADRLVTFFTKEMGLIKVLAKGVRKIPSRRGGHLEPLTIVNANIAGKDGRWYLAAVDTDDYLADLRAQSQAHKSAQFLARLATGCFEYEVAYPAVFAALRQTWRRLAKGEAEGRWLIETAAAMLILREAGVMMRLDVCRECGRREPSENFYLDPEKGGWVCVGCGPASWMVLEGGDLVCLRQMAGGPSGSLRLAQGINRSSARLGRAMRKYAENSTFALN